MKHFNAQTQISRPRVLLNSLILPSGSLLFTLLLCQPAKGMDYPWGILISERDSRDQEMRAFDELPRA
jgi:hypothetical protein